MKVLIVCHAGAKIGLGHLSRSIAIANSLNQHFNANVHLLIQGEQIVRKELSDFKHSFVHFGDDLAEIITLKENYEIVFLDLHYQYIPSNIELLFKFISSVGTKIIAIDGLLPYRHLLDLIFIPSFQFRTPKDLPSGAPIVFGWDCFLIKDQPKPLPWRTGSKVLALTGGCDVTGLGKNWPNLINKKLVLESQLNWVTGPFAHNPVLPNDPRIKILEHSMPDGLSTLMRETNYAITVFGVSFFELLYHGIPTVVFSPYDDKDIFELNAIRKTGVALVAKDEYEATDILVELMNNNEQAKRLSKAAKGLLKKSGTHRLCHEISLLMNN